jgi:hypothetical protein
MNITTEAVLAAISAMTAGRRELMRMAEQRGAPLTAAEFATAQDMAVAEGRFRGQLMQALPKAVPLREAA